MAEDDIPFGARIGEVPSDWNSLVQPVLKIF
jgi:hypothetical protein